MLSVTFYEIELPIKINKILKIASLLHNSIILTINVNRIIEIASQIC